MRAGYFFLIEHPLLLLALALAPCAMVSVLLRSRSLPWWFATRLALGASGAMFVVFGALYFSRLGFLDHVEAQVAAVAALKLHGGSVYHDFDGTKAYAIGYGPALYGAVETSYRFFGEGLRAAKLPALFAIVVAFTALFASVRRLPGGAAPAWRTVLVAAALGLTPFAAQFWTRADPLLYGCAAASLMSVALRPGWLAGVVTGLLVGIAVNLKLHGGVYFLPVLAMLWVRQGRAALLWTGLVAATLLILPFLPWSTNGRIMLGALKVNAGHGFSLTSFEHNLEWAVFLAAPVVAALVWRTKSGAPLTREIRLSLNALAAAMLAVCFVASKPGAGNWHLLPFIPIVLWLAVRCSTADDGRNVNATPDYAVFAWCAMVAFLGWTRHDNWVVYLWQNDAAAQQAEVRTILDSPGAPTVMMGAGSDVYGPGYRATFVRPVLAFARQPYTFDPVAIMDLRKAGRPDEICASPALLGDKVNSLVLIPHGEEPFAMAGFYAGSTCFPESFRAAFLKNFERGTEGRWFDIWVRRNAPSSVSPRP